jgi:hypothetical protein
MGDLDLETATKQKSLNSCPSNVRAHRTQTTFASYPAILGSSGAARLLGAMH